MRWTRFRVVRLMTLLVPAVWFLYVLQVFLAKDAGLPDDDPPAARRQQAVDSMAVVRHPAYNISATMVPEGQALGNHGNVDAQKPQLQNSGVKIPDKDNGNDGLLGNVLKFPEGKSDLSDLANITYPPFIERLPPNAEGQGPKGLQQIREEWLPADKRQEFQAKWKANSFNQYASDLIPVHRDLPDVRPAQCQSKKYPTVLPRMSVIIIFHNEAWSVLLRSVHSILDRTQPDQLLEVILVDDFSDMEHLKKPLDKYFRDYPKVKVVRSEERGGLTRARLLGCQASGGEVLVFLDSHIECTKGWAEPLLAVIAADYKAVPFPAIDMISAMSLAYGAHGTSPVGGLALQTLTFIWASSDMHVIRTRPTAPDTKPSPTMPGGLFAISRRWFEELGGYDPDLKYWGGENMELSFKTWMCGGSLVVVDCSHIGHIFRSTNPITWSGSVGAANYVRVALVWMDEYKHHYLERINYNLGDYGDITDRVLLRKRLKCHSFDWYVDNIYPELRAQIVQNATYAGYVKHDVSGQCLDKMRNDQAGPQLFPCHNQGANQFWYLKDDRYLLCDSMFVRKKDSTSDGVSMHSVASDLWRYEENTKRLRHVTSDLCLQKKANEPQGLVLRTCSTSDLQRWTFQRRQPLTFL